uniref:Putative site-specific DNA endonuclease n=1 Tax=Stigeoclonium helveticum TaxID=55999 RepID=Q06SC9_STIHE|nr:putative site-specific DNA endonuclease [Stigeoclonium helveticum]ABF60223.1 putative site-specific DNA endonuclease [Stigeoclonium helveticum]
MTKRKKSNSKSSYSLQTEKIIIWVIARVKKGLRFKPGTYSKFIERMRLKETQGNTEKHHILPRHRGGSDDPSNLIVLEVRDHIAAHLIHYLEFGYQGDIDAYIFRKATSHIDFKTQGQKIAELNRLHKRGWFNPEVQRELGLRGGAKGGLANTAAQFEARSKVGNKYGKIVGISNQSENLKSTLKCILIFKHTDAPDTLFYISPQVSAYAVAEALNSECESMNRQDIMLDLPKIKKGGPWYALLRGKRKKIYGWTIIEIIADLDILD